VRVAVGVRVGVAVGVAVGVLVGVRVGVWVIVEVGVGVGVAGIHSVRTASSGGLLGFIRKEYCLAAILLLNMPIFRFDTPLAAIASFISEVTGDPDDSTY
jgi:hypothetical protein